jgi:hypothetical protein
LSEARATPDIQVDNAFISMVKLTDTVAPWAIRAAATLRLADHVSPTGASFDLLLKRLDDDGEAVDHDAVRRLLRYLTTLGVFDHDEPSDSYGLTPLSALMSTTSPVSMRDWWRTDSAMCRLDQTPALMTDAIRTGRPVYEQLFGRDVWADLARDPKLAESFENAMAHKTRISLGSVIDAIDWSAAGDVVDVGGGHGLLLEAILREAPAAHGTVFDTAAGVATARTHLAGSSTADRVEFVEGTFFERWPAGADTYVLMNVLHNWSDSQVVQILRNGETALHSGGRLLVIETLVGGAGDQASLARLDLMMLLFCGGKERSRTEYDQLAAAAGLVVPDAYPTSFGLTILELQPTRSHSFGEQH